LYCCDRHCKAQKYQLKEQSTVRPYPQKIDRKKKDAEIAKQQEQWNCVWQPNKKVQVNKATKDVRVHQVRKQGKARQHAGRRKTRNGNN